MSIGLYKIKYYKLIACSPFGFNLGFIVLGLSPDPQQDPYKTGRYMLCGSGVKKSANGALGHFRKILSCKLQAASPKLQA